MFVCVLWVCNHNIQHCLSVPLYVHVTLFCSSACHVEIQNLNCSSFGAFSDANIRCCFGHLLVARFCTAGVDRKVTLFSSDLKSDVNMQVNGTR